VSAPVKLDSILCRMTRRQLEEAARTAIWRMNGHPLAPVLAIIEASPDIDAPEGLELYAVHVAPSYPHNVEVAQKPDPPSFDAPEELPSISTDTHTVRPAVSWSSPPNGTPKTGPQPPTMIGWSEEARMLFIWNPDRSGR
jgi:hypothetical protein